jgi:hypothetical protein
LDPAQSAPMGFLKKFFRNGMPTEVAGATTSSFETLSEDELETHLEISRYGSFTLSEAVRPSFDLDVVPSAGYRFDVYRDAASRQDVPVIMAAASRENLFDTFMDMIEPLGNVVDVVLETSHQYTQAGHQDLYREHIDVPILKSILWDFEDLLVNDGCTGIAILNPSIPQEVQFDEHKLLIAYGNELTAYEQTLRENGLDRRDEIRFITEAEHVHSTNDEYMQQFEQLRFRLGIETSF